MDALNQAELQEFFATKGITFADPALRIGREIQLSCVVPKGHRRSFWQHRWVRLHCGYGFYYFIVPGLVAADPTLWPGGTTQLTHNHSRSRGALFRRK